MEPVKSKALMGARILRIASTAATILFALLRPGMLLAGDGNGNNYVGADAGFAILSGNGRAVVGLTGNSFSLYKPQTGGAFSLFVGRHLTDYLTVQGNYIWNSNDLTP